MDPFASPTELPYWVALAPLNPHSRATESLSRRVRHSITGNLVHCKELIGTEAGRSSRLIQGHNCPKEVLHKMNPKFLTLYLEMPDEVSCHRHAAGLVHSNLVE